VLLHSPISSIQSFESRARNSRNIGEISLEALGNFRFRFLIWNDSLNSSSLIRPGTELALNQLRKRAIDCDQVFNSFIVAFWPKGSPALCHFSDEFAMAWLLPPEDGFENTLDDAQPQEYTNRRRSYREMKCRPRTHLIMNCWTTEGSPPNNKIDFPQTLSQDSVEQLVADSLMNSRKKVTKSGFRLYFRKTLGNPFFMRQSNHAVWKWGIYLSSINQEWPYSQKRPDRLINPVICRLSWTELFFKMPDQYN